jgi:hypothetical protein
VLLPTLLAVSAGCAGSLKDPERFMDAGSDGGLLEAPTPQAALPCSHAMPVGGGLTDGEANCFLEWFGQQVDGGTE